MRLINHTARSLEQFPDASRPPYAILSHRWEPQKDQVTFQDFKDGQKTCPQKDWAKLHGFYDVAAHLGHSHVWVDTCCFDKTSSEEMSETINSMFRWYCEARVCVAYLSDFDSQAPRALEALGRSEWFFRGWTLQELIAPRRMEFYDRNWTYFGTRTELAPQISAITGIDEQILRSDNPGELLPKLSIAKRMSWAAFRETSRPEDRAYSLLGIFGVNIPMLYGEGDRAFIRLQEEILKESSDLTLFAWTAQTATAADRYRGILARSPAEFADAGHIVLRQNAIFNPEYTLTNKGFRTTEILAEQLDDEGGMGFLGLNCVDQRLYHGEPLGIFLKPRGGNIFLRQNPETLSPLGRWLPNAITRPVAYITKDVDLAESDLLSAPARPQKRYSAIEFNFTSLARYGFSGKGYPSDLWSAEGQYLDTKDFVSFTGYARITRNGWPRAILACGFDGAGKPWVCVGTRGDVMFDAAIGDDLRRMAESCPPAARSSSIIATRQELETVQYTVQASITQRSAKDNSGLMDALVVTVDMNADMPRSGNSMNICCTIM